MGSLFGRYVTFKLGDVVLECLVVSCRHVPESDRCAGRKDITAQARQYGCCGWRCTASDPGDGRTRRCSGIVRSAACPCERLWQSHESSRLRTRRSHVRRTRRVTTSRLFRSCPRGWLTRSPCRQSIRYRTSPRSRPRAEPPTASSPYAEKPYSIHVRWRPVPVRPRADRKLARQNNRRSNKPRLTGLRRKGFGRPERTAHGHDLSDSSEPRDRVVMFVNPDSRVSDRGAAVACSSASRAVIA